MLAAEQNQAEQELPKSICQPRLVRLNAGSGVYKGRPASIDPEQVRQQGGGHGTVED